MQWDGTRNMQAIEQEVCTGCSSGMVDLGDELVCPCCGVVGEKLAEDAPSGFRARGGAEREPLGSFMGSFAGSPRERSTKGITGTSGSYRYLKTVSDTAGKDGGSAVECARTIERVGERLRLPEIVIAQAGAVARKVLSNTPPRRRITVAAVSAFSLIAACRIERVASVSAREVIDAHVARGRRVTSSAVIQLAIDSPVKTYARGAAEYVPMILARLSATPDVQARLSKGSAPQAVYFGALRETALALLALVGEGPTAGKRPCALAASAVYSAELALSLSEGRRKRLTQRELSECGDAAEYTIREQCASLFTPVAMEMAARRSRSPPPP